MRDELVAERSRRTALETQCAELEAQLHEVVKLSELMAADLERYKKVVESSRPNHPERVPEDQLQRNRPTKGVMHNDGARPTLAA
jgi:hypothetical protein